MAEAVPERIVALPADEQVGAGQAIYVVVAGPAGDLVGPGVPSRVSDFGVPFIVAASTAPPVNSTSNATTTITFAVFLMPGPFS